MLNRYQKFARAAAAGGATDAEVLVAVLEGLGSDGLEFAHFKDLVRKIIKAHFYEAVPWPTSNAHFEVEEAYEEINLIKGVVEMVDSYVRFISCMGTVVVLGQYDTEPHVWLPGGVEADTSHYRVRAMQV